MVTLQTLLCFIHQLKTQLIQLKEKEEQLTTAQHEVAQRKLRLQELEEQLQGSQDHGSGLQRKVDEYCSSLEKLEHELEITKQKHQSAIQEVILFFLHALSLSEFISSKQLAYCLT